MKSKKLNTKTKLSKTTVANLDQVHMNRARGGYETEIYVYCASIVCSVVNTFCEGQECVTRYRTICD